MREDHALRKDLFRTGWVCSVCVGILYVAVGISHFCLPAEQLSGGTEVTRAFFESLARNSFVFSLHYWLFVLLAILSVPVIAALYELVRSQHPAVALWTAVLGLIGAALAMVDFATGAVEAPRIAQRFLIASSTEQAVIVANGLPQVDPCFLAWGLMGIWALAGNVLAWKGRRLPRFLCVAGVIGGGAYLLAFLGSVLQAQRLVDAAVGVGGLLIAPIWFVGLGVVLAKVAKHLG